VLTGKDHGGGGPFSEGGRKLRRKGGKKVGKTFEKKKKKHRQGVVGLEKGTRSKKKVFETVKGNLGNKGRTEKKKCTKICQGAIKDPPLHRGGTSQRELHKGARTVELNFKEIL